MCPKDETKVSEPSRQIERFRRSLNLTQSEFAKRLGLRIPEEGALAPAKLRAYRKKYVQTMRAYNRGEEKPMRSWTLPFLIRHSAFHVMDHAWEMEDKDLSGEASSRAQ